ncbi:glycosyltransferase family 2 protein [Ligilactobacillus sp. LYQ135]
MLGNFELYYPVIMSFVWIIGSIFFNLSERQFVKYRSKKEDDGPLVEIFMSCYNEETMLSSSIESLEKITYKNYRIILIDDKSTDNTLEVMHQLVKKYSNIVVKAQPENMGKAMALNRALKESQAEYILCVDADTEFEKDAVSYLVSAISADKKIAAVTGRPIVKNVSTIMGKLQFLEYIMNIDMIKRAQSFFLGHILTVSGVLTLFRKSALDKINGWSTEAMTEDIDATWRMYDHGYYCTYQPRALCKIYVPGTIRGFIRQRIRWGRGGLEVLRNHFSKIPVLTLGQRLLALDMCCSYLWVFAVSFATFKVFFEYFFIKNLRISLGALVVYYLVTLMFYGYSKYVNQGNDYIQYTNYWLYLPVFFYAYWLSNIIVVFSAFYHLFDAVRYAAWGASDRGES